jgi:hypothetical protein
MDALGRAAARVHLCDVPKKDAVMAGEEINERDSSGSLRPVISGHEDIDVKNNVHLPGVHGPHQKGSES